MGGPCRLPPAEGRSLRRAGPAATDNFQVRPFEYGGHTYHSCEHAYQAMKFTASSEDFRRMVDIVPRVGESDSAHGMRCWNEGQRGSKRAYREDWDCAKVRIMLDVNRAKYAAHADLRADLVATGDVEITGGTYEITAGRPLPVTRRSSLATRRPPPPVACRHPSLAANRPTAYLDQGNRRRGASVASTMAGSTGMAVYKC